MWQRWQRQIELLWACVCVCVCMCMCVYRILKRVCHLCHITANKWAATVSSGKVGQKSLCHILATFATHDYRTANLDYKPTETKMIPRYHPGYLRRF